MISLISLILLVLLDLLNKHLDGFSAVLAKQPVKLSKLAFKLDCFFDNAGHVSRSQAIVVLDELSNASQALQVIQLVEINTTCQLLQKVVILPCWRQVRAPR